MDFIFNGQRGLLQCALPSGQWQRTQIKAKLVNNFFVSTYSLRPIKNAIRRLKKIQKNAILEIGSQLSI